MVDPKKPDEPAPGQESGSTKKSGWGGLVDDVDLGGSPSDQVGLVGRDRAMTSDADYTYKPSADDIARKQDHMARKTSDLSTGEINTGGVGAAPETGRGSTGELPALRMPTGSGGSGLTGGLGAPPKISPELFQPAPRIASAAKPSYTQPIVIALAVLGLAGGAYYYFVEGAPVPPAKGSIIINSTPEGATVYVGGAKTEHRTPFELVDVLVGSKTKISVQLADHVAVPRESEVVIPTEATQSSVFFALRKTKTFFLETEPPGADIFINGKILPGVAPRKLPPAILGESLTVAVVIDGYLRKEIVLKATPDAEIKQRIELQKAKVVTFLSEPPGATVRLNDEVLGTTPLYDFSVPYTGRVRISFERKGYIPWKKRVRGKTLAATLEVSLIRAPLSQMPLVAEERRELRQIEQGLAQAQRKLRASKKRLKAVERLNDKVMNNPKYLFGQRARAQREMDLATAKVNQLEQSFADFEVQLETVRERIIARIESEGP